MDLFNRKPTFTAAECPRCGGRLELDSNYEIGYCKECGCQVVVQNVKKKYIMDPFDKLTSFIDKQQNLMRQDKMQYERKLELEKQQKLMIKEKRRFERNLWWSKHYKKVIIISVIVIILSYILKYLGV